MRLKRKVNGVADASAPMIVTNGTIEGIAAELQRTREAIVAAQRRSEELEQRWRDTDDEAAAEAIDRERRSCLWQVAHGEQQIPEIQTRLAAAKGARVRAALIRYRERIASLHPRLIAALRETAAINREIIDTRQTAHDELGEAVVANHIPRTFFGGLVLPDLVEAFAKEMDRVWAMPWRPPGDPPPPPSAAVLKPAAAIMAPAPKVAAPLVTAQPTTRITLIDPGPPGDGERQIVGIRYGADHTGRPLAIGEKRNIPADAAMALARSGSAEFVDFRGAP